jgi:hypothetical protein
MILREIYIQPYYFRPCEARETVPLKKGAVAQDFHPLFFFSQIGPTWVPSLQPKTISKIFYSELKKRESSVSETPLNKHGHCLRHC